jgi:hypothetical protein
MTLNNAEERRAWVAFAAACLAQEDIPIAGKYADMMLEEYRSRLPEYDRLPATPAADGPDWSTAPEWATCWTQDADKWRGWWELEAECGEEWWCLSGSKAKYRCQKYEGPYVYPGDWRDSKIRRPR